jgi:hypothetical protein
LNIGGISGEVDCALAGTPAKAPQMAVVSAKAPRLASLFLI